MKPQTSLRIPSVIARPVAIGLLVGLLGACGGGGSSSSSNPPPPPPPPVSQPMINVFAGVIGATGNVDGPVASAQFNLPVGLAADAAGDLYIADNSNFTIRKVSGGVVSTIAGTPGLAGSADGVGNAALFSGPSLIASDSAGNLYVTDEGASATGAVIRKITPAAQVTTLTDVATGLAILTDGSGAVGVDSQSNVYVFTSTPTQPSVLTQITPAGDVNLISLTSLGGGALALVNPQALVIDSANNLYVTDDDLNGNAGVLYKITLSSGTAGVVTTLAGSTAVSGATDGPGNLATFDGLDSLTLDPAGNIFVSDFNNSTIREVSPAGVVSTIAGIPGQTALVTGPLPATLPDIGAVLWSGQTLYASDIDDNVILGISPLQ